MIRLGTRSSRLAVAQARLVADGLGDAELVPIQTAGDHDRERRFDQIGDGTGVFTRAIERALAAGEIDAAVHSAKDLTGEMPAGLVIGAMLEREDPRDAVCGPFAALDEIPDGARVGTSSARRAARLAELRPGLAIVPLRGNVDTRLRKLDAGDADAIVLAAAGLVRLGLAARIGFLFDPQVFVPEAGQGAIAVQVRRGEERLVAALDHAPTREAVEAERAAVASMGGGCSVPVAAYAWHEGGRLQLRRWAAA
ncbi:MAG TPA: hydroxymethylbilane synthase [Gaiellales bacterium]|jgi:hydroxymethylbilane synthase